jgi:uncharacterized protein (TIGR03085 family)
MTTYAAQERRGLADLMIEKGPHAPTLCAGWEVQDLAAHLVLRERRLDAAAGIVVPALRGYTARVQREVRDARPWPAVVDAFRSGPPPLMRPLDEQVNAVELFIHHEDVLRAQPGWEPRALDPGEERFLWRRVGAMRVLARLRVRDGLTLVAPGHGSVVVRQGDPHVTVTGPPGELLLYMTGRRHASRVDRAGPPDALARLDEARLGL